MTQSLARTDHELFLDSLRKVIYELQAATSIETLSEVVTSYIQTRLGYELVWLGLYHPDTSTLEGSWRNYPDSTSASKTLSVLPGDLFDQVLLTRCSATIPNLQDEGRVGSWQQLAQDLNIQGAVLQVIRYQKESLGVLLIGTSKWGVNPRQEESEQFAILANTLGATVQYLQSMGQGVVNEQPNPVEISPLLQGLTQTQSWDDQLTSVAQDLSHLAPVSGLYLLEPESGDFVSVQIHKPQATRSYRSPKPGPALSFHQNSSFFRTLERQNGLAISDISSSTGTSVPNTLVTFLGTRALLFQPILIEKSLKGFLLLGHADPTEWSKAAKEALSLRALLVALTYPSPLAASSPLEHLGDGYSRLNTCILPSPLSDQEDWEKGLNNWFKSLTQQFQCQWSILLTYDADSESYFPTRYVSGHRRAALDSATAFRALSQVDEKLILRHDKAVDLGDLQEDLRLVAWRDQFLAQGIQSILVSRVSENTTLDQLLILGNTTARTWSSDDAKDLQKLARNLHQAEQRRKMHVEMIREKRLNQVFRQGLQLLQATKSSQSFVEKAARILVELFNIKGCGILLWPPRRKFAKVKAVITPGSDQFSLAVGTKVELNDAFIQTLIQPAKSDQLHLEPMRLSSRDLSDKTQRWLSIQGDWSIAGLPLQPQPKQPVFGILFLAHSTVIDLTEKEQETLSDFTRHMAWVLCSSHVTEAWRKDYEEIHTAQWYRNKQLGFAFEGILRQCQPLRTSSGRQVENQSLEAIAAIDQTVTQLYDSNAKLIPSLALKIEEITLVRLLRELLDRLESTFAAKQIWVQVHHLKQSNLALKSSKEHLVCVLDEVLKAATARSEAGGRIDIWCQMNQPEWLDLSITDSGILNPRFVQDLRLGHHRDRLRPSPVTEDLGHRLLACQSLVQALGGKLEFRSLEDKRTLTRFTLPCVAD